jgi:DnaJ-class molecular chaperone
MLSYQWFCENGARLEPNFNLKDLKAGFRKLALKYHPDVFTGPQEQFLNLRESYTCLLKLFKA